MTGQRKPEKVLLTAPQLRFIEEYMIDRNARAAGLRTGGTVNSGQQYLEQEIVREEIKRRTEERSRRVDITKDDVIRELQRMAFYDVRKLFRPDGKVIQNPNDLNEDDARGLVNFGVVVLNKEGDHIIKLEPGNKMKALELLGKHLGIFNDKVDYGGTVVHYHTDFGDEQKPEPAKE
jgi:phage terminase small subunit